MQLPHKRDLAASLVTFLVALPLSMGIALASGAPLASGLIAAAIGGMVGGALGGAPLLVSGPAAGLAVMVFDLIERFGFATLGVIAMVAGVIQIVLGCARVASFATAIAPAVLHGMLAGIGILIAVAQMHVVVGSTPHSAVWRNLATMPQALASVNIAAALLGALTAIILVVWPRSPLRRTGIPPALAAVVSGTLVAYLLGLDVPRVSLPHDILSLQLPVVPQGNLLSLGASALAMALIASAESLLSAVAVDKMHGGPRANLNRELVAQGTSNMLSGLLGGLPVTGVIVRSTANIEAGARSRWSSVLHGAWVVVAVGTLTTWLNQIPLAVLAALLVVVGLRLVNLRELRTLHAHGESIVYGVTVGGVVGLNLLAGIGLGLAAAVLRLFWQLTRSRLQLAGSEQRYVLSIGGAATFLLVPKLTQVLGGVPAGANVRIEIDALVVDHAAREALHNFRVSHEAAGGSVEVRENRRRPWVPTLGTESA